MFNYIVLYLIFWFHLCYYYLATLFIYIRVFKQYYCEYMYCIWHGTWCLAFWANGTSKQNTETTIYVQYIYCMYFHMMHFIVSKAKRQSTERLVVHFSLSLCKRYLQLKQIWWEFESYVKSIFLPRAWLLVSTDQQILSADVKRMITMATPKYRWQVLVIRTRLIKLLKHKHRACPQEYAKKPALTHGSGFPSCLLPSRPAWTDRQTDGWMEGRKDGRTAFHAVRKQQASSSSPSIPSATGRTALPLGGGGGKAWISPWFLSVFQRLWITAVSSTVPEGLERWPHTHTNSNTNSYMDKQTYSGSERWLSHTVNSVCFCIFLFFSLRGRC